ncbi:MAG: sulfotransferase family protein [Proteobacteria bacterium]|nr:sulfotransferase family protein [Pseudomonadota bacterium]
MEATARAFVTVVSGVPRSGTSLVMQMLAAGGVPVLCDGARVPDEDNPRGYFEYEPVKATARDSAWVSQAQGKAVKVVHRLLPLLPPGSSYRVALVERELGEVLASQRAMLERRGEVADDLPEARLAEIFRAQLDEARAWAAHTAGVTLLSLQHRELIGAPASAARELAAFVDPSLDVDAMEACVDRSLWRQRG